MSSQVPQRRQEFRIGGEVGLIQRSPLTHPLGGRGQSKGAPVQGDTQVWWQEVEVVLV